MKQNKQIIANTLRNNFADLTKEFGVCRFGLFGSFLHGDMTKKSDVDILVEFYRPIGLFRFLTLQYRLQDILGRQVDLATPNALKRSIKDRILSEVLYV